MLSVQDSGLTYRPIGGRQVGLGWGGGDHRTCQEQTT